MGFNWVGAAKGVDASLQEQIKRQMEQQQMELQNRKLSADVENSKAQREINAMNAESLAESRKSAAEARQQVLDDKKSRADSLKKRGEWAAGIVTSAGTNPPKDWQGSLDLARAKNILATGEDLPDSAITQIVASYTKNPQDRLLTPEEEAQQIRLKKAEAAVKPPSSAELDRQDRRTASKNTNDFIAWLVGQHKGDPAGALKHFDEHPEVALQKGGGYVTIADMRKLVEFAYGKPKTIEEKMKEQAMAAAATGVAGKGEK